MAIDTDSCFDSAGSCRNHPGHHKLWYVPLLAYCFEESWLILDRFNQERRFNCSMGNGQILHGK